MELPLGVNEAVPMGEEDPTFGGGTSWVESSFTSIAMPPIPPDIEPVDPEVPDGEALEVELPADEPELPDAELSDDLLIPAQDAIASETTMQTYRCIASPVW
jgi:hypothetical protein